MKITVEFYNKICLVYLILAATGPLKLTHNHADILQELLL